MCVNNDLQQNTDTVRRLTGDEHGECVSENVSCGNEELSQVGIMGVELVPPCLEMCEPNPARGS